MVLEKYRSYCDASHGKVKSKTAHAFLSKVQIRIRIFKGRIRIRIFKGVAPATMKAECINNYFTDPQSGLLCHEAGTAGELPDQLPGLLKVFILVSSKVLYQKKSGPHPIVFFFV